MDVRVTWDTGERRVRTRRSSHAHTALGVRFNQPECDEDGLEVVADQEKKNA